MELKSFDRGIPLHGLSRKLLLIMKLTTFIMIIALAQVSAKGLAQKITLNTKNTPIEKVLQSIREQSGFGIIYETNDLKNETVSLNLTNATIDEAMQQIIKGLPYTFEIVKNTVVLNRRQPGFLDKIVKRFQNIKVSGVVKDETGMRLAGATVKVKGSALATTTNKDGEFTLNAVPDDAVLVISFIGYQTAEVKANSSMNVVLAIAFSELKEVVVNKGYYSTTKELNTGSVSTINGDVIASQPVSDPILALAGRIPGLEVNQRSGMLGRSPTFSINGQNSIRLTNAPLIVIDGIPMFNDAVSRGADGVDGQNYSIYNNINPSDIESVTVLRDADATAIYGSRGANGVMLITTKGASFGIPKFEVAVNQGISTISSQLKLLNADQYLEMRKEAFKNDGITTIPANAYDLNGTWTNKVDWLKLLYGNNAKYTDAQVRYSGGNEYTKYNFNLGYNRQTNYISDDFYSNRFTGLFRLQHTSKDKKFTFNFSPYLSRVNNFQPTTQMTGYTKLAPLAPQLYNADGSLNFGNGTFDNPFGQLKKTANEVVYFMQATSGVKYNIFENLSIGSDFAFNYNQISETDLYPKSAWDPAYTWIETSSKRNYNSVTSYNINPKISYFKSIAQHNLSVDAGATIFSQLNTGDGFEATGFTSDDLIENFSAATTKNFFNTIYSKYNYLSSYIRLGYNYNEKYVINLTGNRDGSTRFGKDHKFSNFGAIGAAWIISKESIFQEYLPVVSLAKLRSSYGVTGSDAVGNYKYLDTYDTSTNPYLGVTPLSPSQINNPDFHWEKVRKFEVALDLGFFKNRITTSVGYYKSRTSDQLVPYNLPGTTGFTSVLRNFPAIVSNRNWQFEAQANMVDNKNFKWSTSLNLTLPKNKLEEFPGIESTSYASSLAVGQPITSFKVYHVIGVDPQTGIYQIEDVNKDGLYRTADDGKRINTDAKLYGGLSNRFSYKNFDLDVFFQYVNRPLQRNYRTIFDVPGQLSNQPEYVLDRWQKAGDIAPIQAFGFNTAKTRAYSRGNFSGDYGYSSGTFFRLKTVQLAYNFNASSLNKFGINNLRITCSAQNLFTLTDYQGFDPETNSSSPLTRTITLGLHLGF